MLVQSHREYYKTKLEGCFAVGKSEEEIFKDLKDYCNHHPGRRIYYYIHPVRPSKVDLRPEYMMEIELGQNTESIWDDIAHLCWSRAL